MDPLNPGEDEIDDDKLIPGIEDQNDDAPELADENDEILPVEAKDPPKTSVRDSLKRAQEQVEKAEPVVKDKANKEITDALSGVKPDKEIKPDQPAVQPPTSWSNEAKAEYAKLPATVQAAINKREQEMEQGRTQYAATNERLKALDTVLAPRAQAIKNLGVSEAETVGRLFQWMDELAGANKLEVYKQLGKNFGIDVSQLGEAKPQENVDDTNVRHLPQEFISLQERVDQIAKNSEERETALRAEAAAQTVTNWAKDKPHFAKVRVLMGQLTQSGAVPLKDGQIDLDAAYEQACYANPEVRQALLTEQASAKETEAKANAEKMAKLRAQKLAKAKLAGSSIKPGATNSVPGTLKVNGARKHESARESIRNAIKEVSDV